MFYLNPQFFKDSNIPEINEQDENVYGDVPFSKTEDQKEVLNLEKSLNTYEEFCF